MFIYNFKLNNNLCKKILIFTLLTTLLIVFAIVGLRFYNASSKFTVNDTIDESKLEINSNNYTNILKDSHDNIDKYIGKKLKFTGFIYRLYDFNENQFVLAREMIISSNNQAVVVGFLCNSNESNKFENGSWVEVEGIIEKGNYHGDIPIVKVTNISKTNAQNDEYVYPPDMNYIQ